ncbi:kinase-like domain-containing protein [Collybia nuda]|uniref:Kinase-like domain-containing protein n=1 Tax=Collybia nuda TaxID=64659 RepID=A0A9P5Y3Y8_9AGAR|nr:kinase-like domain-containing protein [Collybia nuda]
MSNITALDERNTMQLDKTAMAEYRLYSDELFWRDRYNLFKDRGYLLRPRYHPEWVASWKGTNKNWLECEDGLAGEFVSVVMFATRLADGAQVILKKLNSGSSANEIAIGKLFSSEPYRSNPSNYCLPLLDVFSLPDEKNIIFLVIPFLSHWENPKFVTIGEAVAFFQQIFEGLNFMHSLNVAHNDVKFDNIMMDSAPLYNEPIHVVDYYMNQEYTRLVKRQTRTLCPVRYYYIDFGSAVQYNPEDGPPRIQVGHGGDRTVPEFKNQTHCDPFAVDVYRLGNIIRECFTDGDDDGDGQKYGFDFMRPLLQDMCQDDPQKRPKMPEVVSRFTKFVKGLSGLKLRSRVVSKEQTLLRRIVLFPVHWTRQLTRFVRHVPAIPAS